MLRPIISAFVFLFIATLLHSQDPIAKVAGTVTDEFTEQAIELVTVYVDGTNRVTETNTRGEYRLEVEAGKTFTLIFTRIGFDEERREWPSQQHP